MRTPSARAGCISLCLTLLACVEDTGGLRPGSLLPDSGATGLEDAGAGADADAGADAGAGPDVGPTADAGACVPTTCEAAGIVCGPFDDGCGRNLDCGPCGSWAVFDVTYAPEGRSAASLAWTGAELLLWGGRTNLGAPEPVGATFGEGRWRWVPELGAPPETQRPCMVRVPGGGERVFVWGGESVNNFRPVAVGAIFDGATRAWSPVSEVGRPAARGQPACVATDRHVAVFGGARPEDATGALYDPATDAWRRLPRPDAEHITRMVYTGDLLVVGPRPWLAFDLGSETWRPLPTAGAPSPRHLPGVAWTGEEVLVFGGHDDDEIRLGDAYAWSPATDTWRPVDMTNGPGPRVPQIFLAAGTDVLTWGCASGCRTGYQYDAAHDRWAPMPTNRQLGSLVDVLGVWTGEALALWGGDTPGLDPSNVGWWYVPRR